MFKKTLFSLFAVGVLLGSSYLGVSQTSQGFESSKANTTYYSAEDNGIRG